MSLLSLHYEVDRRAAFLARRDEPVAYDDAMRCWIVTDPNLVLRLLRHRALACEETVSQIATVGERYGIAFDNLLFAARIIPLMNEGDPHVRMRRRMARFLTDRREPLLAIQSGLVDRHLGKIAAAAEVDLVADIFLPLVREYFSVLVDASELIPFDQVAITRMFDRYLSLKTLKKIEQDIGALRATVRRVCRQPVSDGDEELFVALLILGRDSLLATLAESIGATLAGHVGRSLGDVGYPAFPNETGVAIAERVATETIAFGGVEIAAGERVRLYLQSLNYSERASVQRLIFGAGAHSCLGRQLSLDLWPALTGALRAIPRVIASVEHGYVRNHIFAMPDRVRVRLAS